MFQSSVDYFPTANGTLGDTGMPYLHVVDDILVTFTNNLNVEGTFYAGLALNSTFDTGGATVGGGGVLTNHVCEMRGGIVAYQVTLSNGIVMLSPDKSTDKFIKEL